MKLNLKSLLKLQLKPDLWRLFSKTVAQRSLPQIHCFKFQIQVYSKNLVLLWKGPPLNFLCNGVTCNPPQQILECWHWMG